ncbi:MAG: PHP domain-containing protein [Desulfomonile tiedjei]|nr:PHP domain-containing protein [Desulfomonile tiedjei]
MIDLHVHTSMSDGTFSPEEVVQIAMEKGLRAIAITDHDTTAGVRRGQRKGAEIGVEVISGVEISTEWPNGILHLLGYFVCPEDRDLLQALDSLKKDRQERILKIVSRLNGQNVSVTVEEVAQEAVGGVPGRPHVANLIVKKGHVATLQEAFDRYLGKGAPAYVEKKKLSPLEAMQLIANAGGVPVLAHPYSLEEPDADELEKIVRRLMRNGLKGIEVYYPKHTPEQTDVFLDLCRKLDLAATGGTDFHGAVKPDVELGTFPGGKTLPCSMLEELKKKEQTGRDAYDCAASLHK